MKRAIKINGTDIELLISVHTVIDVEPQLLYLEELLDKTWRLTYSKSFISDFTLIKEFAFKADETTKKCKKSVSPKTIDIISNDESVLMSLNISRVIAIPVMSNGRFLTITKNPENSNTWQLRYYTSIIPDIGECTGLTVVRKD